jgi:nucleotide-binding universal stress UspA family protein
LRVGCPSSPVNLEENGRSYVDLEIATQVGAGTKPEKVILSTVEETGFDLLVMGVLYRSVEEGLYFGPKVERILQRAKCAVAVVVSPEKRVTSS